MSLLVTSINPTAGRMGCSMKLEYRRELLRLTPRERSVVLKGLVGKLGYHARTGVLSYRYDVCPVCRDVGSTLEEPRCEECYIPLSCKAPFNDGFRDDPAAGAAYFTEMRELLESHVRPRTLVVGGRWDTEGGKPSSIAAAIATELEADLRNGGHISQISSDVIGYGLVL